MHCSRAPIPDVGGRAQPTFCLHLVDSVLTITQRVTCSVACMAAAPPCQASEPRHNTAGGYLLLVYRDASIAERLRLLWLTSMRTAVGLLDLLLAAAIYALFVLLQGHTPAHHYWWIPISTVGAALAAAGLILSRSLLEIVSIHSVVAYVQARYTSLVLRLTSGYTELRWTSFVEHNRSELLNTTINTAREASFFYHLSIEMTASVIVVAAMTFALVYQSPAAAGGLLVVLLAFAGVHRFFFRETLREAALQKEHGFGALQRILADLFSSGKEVRTYANHGFFYRRIREQAGFLAHSSLRLMVLPQAAKLLADQGVLLLFLAVVVFVEMRHGDVHRMISVLVFYFVLSRRLLPLISQISFMASQMEGSLASVRIVQQELSDCNLHRTPASLVCLPERGFVLELEGVGFTFDRASANLGAAVLHDLDLRQRAGEVVLIHGVSGSGKTSLLNVIAGIAEPGAGVVRVDRQRLAYVPQEIILLDDTVRNNLLFGTGAQSDTELMSALAVSGLDAFVEGLPNGLETRVGDNGILFSGGQRQRLGLARAILRNPTLLLMDEGTAALDGQSEAQVLENLRRHGLAVLLVTHRVQSRPFGDRVLRLRNGRLEEEMHAVDPVDDEQTLIDAAGSR
jgi:ABC-type bacteriocin/lantibiotic exporter with double-glycine peptidase domain